MELTLSNFSSKVIFWSHSAIIFLAVFSGLILPPLIVVSLVVIHRLHIFIFRGCLLSKLQRKAGGLPPGWDFLQFASYKFFGMTITPRQSQIADYLLVSVSLLFAFSRMIYFVNS
jgi:hypothetical protein